MNSIASACRDILQTADPYQKVKAARATARAWRQGQLEHAFDHQMPDAPARPERPVRLPPGKMPKRGKAGSERSRIAMLHALAHIEFAAIDLAFDLIGRFGGLFPRRFVDDWIGVGADEAMHFVLLDRRLHGLGSAYGDLPGHDGLWEAAASTSQDALARLAVIPMVLEARGLDVTPATVVAFEKGGDQTSARVLSRIFQDEIRHVAAGVRWFRYHCESQGSDMVSEWQRLIRSAFPKGLRPPFNDSARHEAGLSREMYLGVARDEFP